MTKRQAIICSHIPKVGVFADVGCDHGYMAQYALENELCNLAVITDISRESLKKAETLLDRYVKVGRCKSVCTDGMTGIDLPDCALIAGMGGEEIIKILSDSGIPAQFILQPMKNAEKVRSYLVSNGCRITADYTFEDGKFYELIVGEREGGTGYTDWEITFGRDNLKNPSQAFLRKIKREEAKLRNRLCNPALSQASREKLRERLYTLEVITDAIERDI